METSGLIDSNASDSGGTVLSRSTWTLADQGLSSLFSLVTGLAAARALSSAEFGVFATLFTSLLMVRGLVKAVALDPITIRHAGPSSETQTGYAWAVTLGAASAGMVVALGASAAWNAVSPRMALSAGLALSFLLAIDTSRMLDIAAGRPGRAAQTSAVLLAAAVAVLGYCWNRSLGLASLLDLLAMAGLLALVARRPRWGDRSGPNQVRRWLAEQWSLAGPLLLELLSNTGALALGVYLLAGLDLLEAGAYRAATMVAGPLYMLYTGITQLVMTEASRPDAITTVTGGPRRDMGLVVARRSLMLSAASAAAYYVAVYLVRDTLGSMLKITDPAHVGTFSAIVIMAALNIPSYVVTGLLRALSRARLLLTVRIISLVPVVASTFYGAFHGGAVGLIRYGIYAEILNLPLWCACLVVGVRYRRQMAGSDPTAPGDSAANDPTPA
jgi:hypothetical protein